MLSNMISYSVSMLSAIGSWLGSEPIVYLFGLVLACFVLRILLSLTKVI